MENFDIKSPSIWDALIPVFVLIALLTGSVYFFADNSSYGPNQIAMLVAAGIAVIIGLKNGFKWPDIEQAIVNGISLSLGAILILLAVGSLIGTWLLSGTVPTLIYVGLIILDPSYFYFASCLICAIVAMSIGSSWTTAATIGVALMGVANGMGMNPAIAAGAVVSGAYFGDKLSPLSETTNLAPAVAGTDLFSHIQYMLWNTIPSFILALILFAILGFSSNTEVEVAKIDQLIELLQSQFNLGFIMLVPLAILLVLAIKKVPAFPAVFIGALIGGIWAVIFQPQAITRLAGEDLSGWQANLTVVWSALFDGIAIQSGDENLDDLLSGGGMSAMLNTVWLVMCAMTFGAVLEKTGLLKRLVEAMVKRVHSAGGLVASTIGTCFGTNVITADQYIAIVMPGRMFKDEYKKRGLHQLNLSRSLEDGGTITSPLIPWNTCGAYMHSVLLVHPFEYIFYAFFNLISPILGIIYAFIGFKILKITPPTMKVQEQ